MTFKSAANTFLKGLRIGVVRRSEQTAVLGPQDNAPFSDYTYRPVPRRMIGAGARKVGEMMEAADASVDRWLRYVEEYIPIFRNIPLIGNPELADPYWVNGFLPALDSMLLYTMVRKLKPKIYLEVGSGNSTKFVRKAIVDGGLSTKVVSIDPHPRASVDAICDKIHRYPVEEMDRGDLRELVKSADMIFVDNSHRSVQNSDVTVFFTEMLPEISSGTIYGVHDIMLPQDYPGEWVDRLYNEQYMLVAYLLGGADGDAVVFPGVYASDKKLGTIAEMMRGPEFDGAQRHAVAFWMQRR